ncbi:MAG: hypothetical protein JNL74_00365 [Fibrobacteres bacterium]|nr:hypothetical protein [Fibrobacterota bacterium]
MPYTLPIQTAALSEEALKRVKSDLGREPNETEKLIYSIMWAGACRSKSPLLIDAGKNLAIAVKAGRHNYSENIGDLVRSIAVCGARPLSLLFSAESAPGELEILIEDASKYANCAALAVSGGNIEVTDTLGKPDATIDFMALGVVEPEN